MRLPVTAEASLRTYSSLPQLFCEASERVAARAPLSRVGRTPEVEAGLRQRARRRFEHRGSGGTLVAAQAPPVPGRSRHPRLEIVDGVAARARLASLEVLEVMPGVVVAFQASFPEPLESDALDAGLQLGIPWVLDVSSPRPVARLAPVLRHRVELLVGCPRQRVFIAGMTPDAHLTSDVRIRLLCE